MRSTVAALPLVLCAAAIAAGPAPRPKLPDIKPDALVPGANLVFEMADLGTSWNTKGKDPIRARVILPKNWDKEHAWPVLVHLGGGDGWREADSRWFSSVFDDKNFVVINTDYRNADGWGSGPEVAIHAIKRFTAATKAKLDTSTMMVTGASSGAYAIDFNGAKPEIAAFRWRIVCIGGGTGDLVKGSRKSATLWVAGDGDLEKMPDGLSRYAAQVQGNQAMKKAGFDSSLIVMKATGHALGAAYKGEIRAWFESRFPPVIEAKALLARAEKAKMAKDKARILEPIKKVYLDFPDIQKAKEALAAAEAEVKQAEAAKKKAP